MSSFQVSSHCISCIVRVVAAPMNGRLVLTFGGWSVADRDGLDRLGQALIEMNARAVARIRAEPRGSWDAVGWRFRPQMPMTTAQKVESYKAMECWLYQCRVGGLPQSELYQDVARARDDLGAEIIRGLPAYRESGWGE